MSKKYVRPSVVQMCVQRYKRRSPSILVDAFDCAHRLPCGFKLRYPYCTNRENYQPFFIIGSGRSGNTLLRKLLMERSKVVIPPEIPGLGSTIRRYTQCGSLSWNEIVKNTLNRFQDLADIDVKTKDTSGDELVYNLLQELSVDFNEVQESLLSINEDERALSTIISSVFESYSIKRYGEVRPWGDKTPWNVFHYDRIRKAFPQARYIHMLRDGRDCVASYIDSLGELMNLDSTSIAHRWHDSVRRAEVIRRESPGRFLEVRYEDLVCQPDKVISGVINFLGLKSVVSTDVHVDSLGDGKAIHHRNLSLPISSRSVGRWKEALSDCELKLVLRVIEKDLEHHGYLI